MKTCISRVAAQGIVLIVLILQAENVDDRIKAIEQELSQLKEQQLELKKETTAAAQAMPTFDYRPGNGLSIEAADKSWSLRTGIETNFRMLFESDAIKLAGAMAKSWPGVSDLPCITALTTVCGSWKSFSTWTALEPATAKTQRTQRRAAYFTVAL